jgi:hypothetical protein
MSSCIDIKRVMEMVAFMQLEDLVRSVEQDLIAKQMEEPTNLIERRQWSQSF